MNGHELSFDYTDYESRVPGVYVQRAFVPSEVSEFRTGVPVFIGRPAGMLAINPFEPVRLSLWSQYTGQFGSAPVFLSYAVRGFFENGGEICYVVPVPESKLEHYRRALEASSELDAVDLVSVPEYPRTPTDAIDEQAFDDLQEMLIRHTTSLNDRFALLDSLPGETTDSVARRWRRRDGGNAALYHPWVKVAGVGVAPVDVPPSPLVAGVYARTDRETGVHKAPANEELEGVFDTVSPLSLDDEKALSEVGVNFIRAVPGRAVRVWGARTMSPYRAWGAVNVRRVLITTLRWIRWRMRDVTFELYDAGLAARIDREISSYLHGLFQKGALQGRSPEEGYYVVSRLAHDATVETEIGIAPAAPFEYIVVRIIHGETGVAQSAPAAV